MSPKQTSLYWRTWAAVCKARGWSHSDSDQRRALHTKAKCPQSMKDFTNGHLDRFLSAARQLLGSRECIEAKDQDGQRKRLLWRIKTDADTAGLPETYLDGIAHDLYGLACWRDLCLADLTNLRNVMHNRASARLCQDTRTVQTEQLRRRRYVLKTTPSAVPAELQPF